MLSGWGTALLVLAASACALQYHQLGSQPAQSPIEVLYQWNFVGYDLPPELNNEESYIPENNLYTGLEVYWDKIFLALPNLRSGVPATLTYLPRPDLTGYAGSSPPLQPYPSWEWQGTTGNCSKMVSVYRTRVDRCDRLWVVDSGVITTLDNFSPVCPPKILVFDLKTNHLVRTIILPREVLRPNSLLTNIELDYEIARPATSAGSFFSFHQAPSQPTCDDLFAYVSDTANAAIIVYDVKQDSTWRIFHPSMLPHPDHAMFTIAGESFTLPDAVVGIAMSPETAPQHSAGSLFSAHGSGSQRLLYFQAFAATRTFSIPTSVLQSRPGIEDDLQIRLVFEKTSQSASLACDPSDGTLFFNPVSDLSIASVQPGNRHSQAVVRDSEMLQFSSDIVISPFDNYNIWFISSKFQQYFRRTYDPHNVNFRIMRLPRNSPAYNNSLYYF